MFNFKTFRTVFAVAMIVTLLGMVFFSFSKITLISILIIGLIILGLGSFFIRLDFYLKSVHRCNTSERGVALTFDDAPTDHSSELLDYLQSKDIKASFFCIGKNIEGREDIIKRMHEEGHLIGNHSFSHKWTVGFKSTSSIAKEIRRTNAIISNITGEEVRFFRPPFGVTNPNIAKALDKIGMKSIGWSIRSLDTILSTRSIMRRIKKGLSQGSIILLHDGVENNIGNTKKVVQIVQANGYKFLDLKNTLPYG